jgi:DNA invertase Pin-like site-specific DNA recombinase
MLHPGEMSAKTRRPVGRFGRHKLDGKEAEIAELLSYRVSKSAIARKFKVSRTCLVDFVQKRGIHSDYPLK